MNRIETNYIELYVAGEKSGSRTVTLTCEDPIEVTYEQFTNRLNGAVNVSITDNFTTEVKFNISFSDLWRYGEIYNGVITAKSGDDILKIPVVINCSDTLIYSNVPNDTVIEVLEGIHITYSSVPDVNKVWIVFEDASETDITDLLNGQTIDLTYEYLLNRFGIADYDYICATNGLSQIAHKLNKVVYTLESISSLIRYIDYRKQDVILHFKSLRNNIPFEPVVNIVGDIDYKMVLVDKEYFLYLSINENGDDVDKVFSVNIIQPESNYTLEYLIIQYKYGEDISGIDWGEYEKYDYVVRYEGYDDGGYIRLIPQRSADWGQLVYPGPREIIYKGEDIKPYCTITNINGSGSAYYTYYFEEKNPIVAFNFGPDEPYDVDEYPSCAHGLFAGCTRIKTIYKFKINPTYKDYSFMFRDCEILEYIEGLKNWDVSNVTNMDAMFCWCNLSNLLYLKNWDVSNVTSMDSIFAGNLNLMECSYIENWNTSNVIRMVGMFSDTQIRIAPKLNTINVKFMDYMFTECWWLKDVPMYDCSNVESTYRMFCDYYGRYCTGLTNLGGFKNLKVDLDLGGCNKLTYQSLMNVINNLAVVSSSPTLSLGTTNLNKLTDEEKVIAINKGWTLT